MSGVQQPKLACFFFRCRLPHMFYACLTHNTHTILPTQRPWHQEDNSSRRASRLPRQASTHRQGGKGWQPKSKHDTLRLLLSILASSPASNHEPSSRAQAPAPAAAAAGGQGRGAPHPGIVPDQVQVSGQDLGEGRKTGAYFTLSTRPPVEGASV